MTSIKIRWLGFACFQISLPSDQVIMTDPFLDASFSAPIKASEVGEVDYIFITHGHFDHVLDVSKIATRCQAKVHCSREVAVALTRHLQLPADLIRTVTPGEVLSYGDLKVRVLRGSHPEMRVVYRHITGRDPGVNRTPEEMFQEITEAFPSQDRPGGMAELLRRLPGGEQLNFIFQTPGNITIYDFASFPHPDLLTLVREAASQIILLQVLPGYEKEAAELALQAGSSLVIPQHHEGLFPGSPKAQLSLLRDALAKRPYVQLLELFPGRWYEVRLQIE